MLFFHGAREGLGGVPWFFPILPMRCPNDQHNIQDSAPTVPKQIDRGTACPLGRGLEVLCGVRLIIIFKTVLGMIFIATFRANSNAMLGKHSSRYSVRASEPGMSDFFPK